jgi:hypothetical protein
MTDSLQLLVEEYHSKTASVEKLEAMLASKEAYWANERTQYLQQKASNRTPSHHLISPHLIS